MTCSSNTTCNPDRAAPRAGRRTLAAALALLAVPMLVGAAPAGRPGQELIVAARAALSRGDGIASEMKLRAAMEQGAARRDVAAWMGKAFLAQGDGTKARQWLAPGDFSPESAADGWRALGLLERLDGHFEASGNAYDKAMALNPRDASLWVEIGRLRYAGGEHRLAIEAADRAIELDGGNVRALEFRGQLVRDRYGLAAALPWFEQAIMRSPSDVPVLLEYAATLGELGRASEALTVARRVSELSPKNPRCYYIQAVIAARAGNYALARTVLAKARGKLDGEPGVRMLQGIIEMQAGNPSAAAEALEAVLRARPDSHRAQELLARALYLGGEYRYATARFAGDVARDDATPYLLTTIARAYEALGDRARAGALLDRAARPRVAPLRVLPHQGEIGALLASGQAMAAQARTEAAWRGDPGFYDSLSLAGDVQLALGRAREAQERYAAAAAIRMPEGLFLRRFQAYGMARDLAGASDLVEGYLRQNPTSRPALRAAASLAAGTRDFDRARAILSWLRANGDTRDVQLAADLAMAQAGEGDPVSLRATALAGYRLQRGSALATQALAYSYSVRGDQPKVADALSAKLRALTN